MTTIQYDHDMTTNVQVKVGTCSQICTTNKLLFYSLMSMHVTFCKVATFISKETS